MQIDIGITVSVGYADMLARTLPAWVRGCKRVIVVTDHQDEETAEVAFDCYASLFRTDAFSIHGASFNKGGALDSAWQRYAPECGWVTLFDADILPPDGWQNHCARCTPGTLYSATRYQDGRRRIYDPVHDMAGYWWLFHTSDPHIPRDPTFTSWQHAGNYDTVFAAHWPQENRMIIPSIRLTHLGPVCSNWWGRGSSRRMREMYRDRERHGGTYDHERV